MDSIIPIIIMEDMAVTVEVITEGPKEAFTKELAAVLSVEAVVALPVMLVAAEAADTDVKKWRNGFR